MLTFSTQQSRVCGRGRWEQERLDLMQVTWWRRSAVPVLFEWQFENRWYWSEHVERHWEVRGILSSFVVAFSRLENLCSDCSSFSFVFFSCKLFHLRASQQWEERINGLWNVVRWLIMGSSSLTWVIEYHSVLQGLPIDLILTVCTTMVNSGLV